MVKKTLLLHRCSHVVFNAEHHALLLPLEQNFLEVNYVEVKDFDKGDLKNDLKNAGFEDCIADDIADRVNDRKTDNWNADMGRTEALKEIEMLINRTRQAYDNFRQRNAPGTSGSTWPSSIATRSDVL
jgi:hypothetical protein